MFEHCKIMYDKAIRMNAKKIVELGTGTGDSTETFGEAIKITKGMLWSIDTVDCVDTKNRLKDFKNINYIKADSIEYAKSWQSGNIDILLCDSDHAYERVLGELTNWTKFNPKVIYIHDTLYGDGTIAPPHSACVDFAKSNGYTFNNHTMTHGLGVLTK